MLDSNIFSRIKTPQDFVREEQEFEARMRAQAINKSDPASVREYNFFSNLSPEEQEAYLRMKRAQQTLNLGGTQAVLNPSGGIQQQYTVTPKISEMPDFKAMQSGAQERAKLEEQLGLIPQLEMQKQSAMSSAERQSQLNKFQAKLPQLLQTADKLSSLGKIATYTKAGQMADFARREMGLPVGKGAIARKEYESVVNNQILPLLRQTFDSQFTEKEGESLKKTLGDIDGSPEEKDAVLRSFINEKIQQIETLKRQGASNQPVQKKELTYNPQTGNFE